MSDCADNFCWVCDDSPVLFADGLLGFLLLGLWLFCIFDVSTTPESSVKHLPKLVWLLLVLILADIGSVIWLVAGRERSRPSPALSGRAGGPAPEYDRPDRAAVVSPEDDEAFLRQLRERADAQRRHHEQQRRAER